MVFGKYPDQAEPIESSDYEFESSKKSRDKMRKSMLLSIFFELIILIHFHLCNTLLRAV